ncbi:DEAD/DEAH box helicase family protein [Thalassotalea montiporae]
MELSQILKSNWKEVESNLEKIESNNEKGDLFEYFSYFYFSYFSSLYDIKEIYCPIVDKKPFPKSVLERLKLEKKDHGVDGVIVNNSGEYIAWQAKFRSKRKPLTFAELSTFWAEAEYADYRLVISNVNKLPPVAHKKSGHKAVLVDHFEHLHRKCNFFDSMTDFFTLEEKKVKIKKKHPRIYQEDIIEDVKQGFEKSTKGKVIAACGIGKTLVALWIQEQLNCKKVVFLAPSLQLVRQTIEEWSLQSSKNFTYMCVCSDNTVDSDIDHNNISNDQIDIPVTTCPTQLSNFLKGHSENKNTFVFATYQSSQIIKEAIKKLDDWKFDLAIYDEAHRTAGVGESSQFTSSVLDSVIPAKLKLFLTATERLLRPSLAKNAGKSGLEAFSMDDEDKYGETFHRLSFGQAIERNIISDYKIIFAGLSSDELSETIKRNLYVSDELDKDESTESAQSLYKRIVFKKVVQELGISKAISFHSKIKEAKEFSEKMVPELDNGETVNFISHLNGAMSAQDRAEIIRDFENADFGLISNVRCLTEGVDIPLIDAVFFSDPKGSMIDIIQAVGRALRQPFGEKNRTSYIIIPVLLDEASEELLSGRGFEALYNLIQALRDQDHELAEWIDSINSQAVRGRSTSDSKGSKLKMQLILPKSIDKEKFEDALNLTIADVNKDPYGTTGLGSKLGKKERKSAAPRVFKTMIDYGYDSCEKSLVVPTIDLMLPNVPFKGTEIKVNNNNVSHCRRIGLIKEFEPKTYKLTELGELYKSGEVGLDDVFRHQMPLYKEKKKELELYPYRFALELLLEVGSLNHIQFVYSLMGLNFNNENRPDLQSAVMKVKEIAKMYPNLQLTNEANKQTILEDLNSRFGHEFQFRNVWTDRTTEGNQFRYILRHLELYGNIVELKDKCITLSQGAEEQINNILSLSKSHLDDEQYGKILWNYK